MDRLDFISNPSTIGGTESATRTRSLQLSCLLALLFSPGVPILRGKVVACGPAKLFFSCRIPYTRKSRTPVLSYPSGVFPPAWAFSSTDRTSPTRVTALPLSGFRDALPHEGYLRYYYRRLKMGFRGLSREHVG